MICISVMRCLSNGLAKSNKIMSMFVLFYRLFGHFESSGLFFRKPYNKEVKQMFLVNFSKVQQLSNNFSKTQQFRLKSEDKPNSRYIIYQRLF